MKFQILGPRLLALELVSPPELNRIVTASIAGLPRLDGSVARPYLRDSDRRDERTAAASSSRVRLLDRALERCLTGRGLRAGSAADRRFADRLLTTDES